MNIKKVLVLTAFAALTATQAKAQENQSESTWQFIPHWYLQLQAGASHTLGEAKFFDLVTPSVQLGAGYQFNPYLGVRAKVNGWQAKGGWVNPEQTYKFNQMGLEADLRLDLTNLIGGYNPVRPVSVGIFAGVGANMAWGNDEAQQLNTNGYKLPYLWDGTKVRPVGNAGLDINFRVSNSVSIGLEANAHMLSDKFNSKKAGNADWYFNALAGVRINLGKTYVKNEPVKEEPVAVEPAPVAPAVKPAPVVEEVKKVEPLRREIFFKINTSKIAESETVKIRDIVAYLNANPNAKITITGFADAGTGNTKINDRLAKERAEAVANTLISQYAIDAARITSESKGSREQPFAENDKNRVSICIAE